MTEEREERVEETTVTEVTPQAPQRTTGESEAGAAEAHRVPEEAPEASTDHTPGPVEVTEETTRTEETVEKSEGEGWWASRIFRTWQTTSRHRLRSRSVLRTRWCSLRCMLSFRPSVRSMIEGPLELASAALLADTIPLDLTHSNI
jgi:hypothetical protein